MDAQGSQLDPQPVLLHRIRYYGPSLALLIELTGLHPILIAGSGDHQILEPSIDQVFEKAVLRGELLLDVGRGIEVRESSPGEVNEHIGLAHQLKRVGRRRTQVHSLPGHDRWRHAAPLQVGDDVAPDESRGASDRDFHDATCSSGTAVTNLPPHAVMYSSCSITSSRRFHGKMTT